MPMSFALNLSAQASDQLSERRSPSTPTAFSRKPRSPERGFHFGPDFQPKITCSTK
jgi:hypothetical protein